MANDLKKRIMRRVYGIWFVKRVIPMAGGSALFMGIAMKETAGRFFVAKIFSNFMEVAGTNAWAIPNFIASALNKLEPSALVLTAGAGLVGFVLAVKLLRSIRVMSQNPGMVRAAYAKK
ncbi:MAG: hypothetical protein UV75_C0002G0096 [Candidatus Giovannonibacteria bacterium GW2011_GWA1_43_15]|nr:MAG: hypothetical protein UV72_C0001G0082 [Candidatus Giovannonibacteria bacterium GW2011_GWB1_43_13]KKS99715.1 MAG: hypothetical protein UV75_C0002G0096 [Candidatus Giovannonibacteria bacterium GW2011_GWA1_43_15]KKT21875.1 MAG: hypothetical protein UW05_C0001G0022 [Candidatus Giovannonibacteria bacterium GW2011_GWC2_43_8]OGF86137.1 MAG: hypothetical protein A3I28_02475 [Candidatus Giovannonibacteria bacterium RIFCSPLOWO2_02_FULL_43_37]